jgi:hypothetical protein
MRGVKNSAIFWNGVQGKLLKGCLDSIIHYDSIRIKVQWQCKKYYAYWLESS